MSTSPGLAVPYEALALPVMVIGACVGSFLNVVAWRLPRDESIVSPPSHCPRCGTPLSWFENLPVIGWLLLRGRCRHCHRSIACRYPLVEVLTAGVWVAVLLGHPEGMGPAPNPWLLLPAGWLLVSLLIPMVLIDLDSLWLPEPLCRWGVLLGLAITALVGALQGVEVGRELVFAHLLATAMGLLGFEAMSALAQRFYGRPALGLGDAKLAAMMGAWLGPAGLGVGVVLAVFSGALIGGAGRLTGRIGPHQPFPFGPFLALGAATVWVSGHATWIQLLTRGALAEGVL